MWSTNNSEWRGEEKVLPSEKHMNRGANSKTLPLVTIWNISEKKILAKFLLIQATPAKWKLINKTQMEGKLNYSKIKNGNKEKQKNGKYYLFI